MKIKMFFMTILAFFSLSLNNCNAMALLAGALGVVAKAAVTAGIRTFVDKAVEAHDLKEVAAQAKEQDAKHYFVMNMMNQAYDVEVALACLRTNSKVTVNAGETQLIYDNASSDARCLVKSVTVYAKGGTTPLSPGTIPYNTAELSGTSGSIIMLSRTDTQGEVLVSAYTFNTDGSLTPVTPPSSSTTGTTGTPSTTGTTESTEETDETGNNTTQSTSKATTQGSKKIKVPTQPAVSDQEDTDADQDDTSSQPNSTVQPVTANLKQIIPKSKSTSQPTISVKQQTIE